MNFVLAAGGTGGHMIPAHALAAELKSRGHGVLLITDERGARFPGLFEGVPVHILPAGRLGGGPIGWLKALGSVVKGRAEAKRLYREHRPDAVVGFGGYPAFPPLDDVAPLKILITGGSQGATILSQVVPEGLGMLEPSLRRRLQVVQQCRPDDIERVRKQYAELGIPAELLTYIEDMPAKLADAHPLIGRAGASTLPELTAAGRPAILLPCA